MPDPIPSHSLAVQAKLFRGFGDPSRLSVLASLRDGPRTVSAIVAATGLSQPNVSNHLACLRDCGLVTARPAGRFVHYELSDPRVAQLLALADELLADVARGVDTCARSNGAHTPVRATVRAARSKARA